MYFWARFGKVSQEISAKIVVSVILSKKTKLATVNDNCELTYSSSFFAYVCWLTLLSFFFQHYLRYIRGLPINDTPEIFALHDNANITFAQNETFSLLQGILKMQPRASSSAGRSREEVCDVFLKNQSIHTCLVTMKITQKQTPPT